MNPKTHIFFTMPELQIGDKAPYFEGPIQDGTTLKLSDFQGKKLVLYFYPKDNTPGCTKQACNLRDGYQSLLDNGYAVVGISNDSVTSHQKFVDKYQLPFPLIADTDGAITEAYGTARMLWFPRRTTFVIDEKGDIEKIIKSVRVTEHTQQILK